MAAPMPPFYFFMGQIDITFNNFKKDNRQQKFFVQAIKKAIAKLNLGKFQIGLSINLVSEEKIKTLNKKYRNKNKKTDVLSFPLINRKIGAGADIDTGGIIELGDIFISPSVAAKEAKKYGTPPKRQLASLAIHGFLHLCGYDHEKTAHGAREMLKLQDEILKSINI